MTINPEQNQHAHKQESNSQIQSHSLKLANDYNERVKESRETDEEKNYINIIDNTDIANSMIKVASVL